MSSISTRASTSKPYWRFKAKMLEAYSRVADPKDKLTEELKELGVIE